MLAGCSRWRIFLCGPGANPAGAVTRWLFAAVLVATLPSGMHAEDNPSSEENQRRIAALIEQLGSGQYIVRQRAEQELVRFGFEAFDAIAAAKQSSDLEVAARAAYVAAMINVNWASKDDPEEIRKLFEEYGRLDITGRLATLREFVKLPDHAGLRPLARVVRYDESLALSKQAALWIMRDQAAPTRPTSPELGAEHRELLENIAESDLANSPRPGAEWVRAYALGLSDPQAAAERWSMILELEKVAYAAEERQTSLEFLLILAELQAANLRSAGREGEVAAVYVDLQRLIPGDIGSVLSLLISLVDQQAWDAFDAVFALHEAAFQDPQYLYRLAGACQVAGGYERAEAYYRRVIETADATNDYWVYSTWNGSDMLHDIGEDRAAAEMLGPLLDHLDSDSVRQWMARFAIPESYVRTTFEYYSARAAAARGDVARQRRHLDLAIAHDPEALDVLIAMYRLDDGDEEYHRQVVGRIERLTSSLRTRIDDSPTNDRHYNQLAWLVSNTEGDFQEAIRLSHTSLELLPNEPAYLDTLAHCYAAVGDYENAVAYQTMAAELDPYTQIIVRKLDDFKAALEDSQRQP